MSEGRRQRAEGRRRPRKLRSFCILHSAFCILVACSKTTPAPVPPPIPVPVAVPAPEPPPAPPPPPASPREQVKAALAQQDVQALAAAADADPIVAPWLRLRIAALTKNNDEAIAALKTIIQQTPASSAAVTARIRLAALVPEAYADTASIAIDEFTEDELVKLAKARADVANAVRMRLLTEYPQGRFTEQTYDFLAKASPSPLDALGFDDALRIANQLANRDHYDQALDMFKRIAARFPNANTQAAYRAARTRALFHSRRYTELLAEPRPSDPALQLIRARAAWRVGQNDEFLKGLANIIQGEGKEAAEALVLRSKYYSSDDPHLDLAARDLEQAIDANNLGNDGENLWALGWTYFLAKRFDDALRTFDRYQQRFPDGDYLSNSLFWAGKIDDRLGNRAKRDAKWHELESKYPYGYFSYRARELAGEAPIPPSEIANGNVFPNVDALIASAGDPRLDAVRELAAVGLYPEATAEMKRVAAAYPTNAGLAYMLADLYVQAGQPFAANNVLQRRFRDFIRHGGSGIPHRFWEILYPLAYWDTIKSEAAKRQLDPYLIASIIRQESGFEPSTVSNAGAVGVMQIMPAEAARIATDAGMASATREQLFDPATNIAVGAAEFSQKLARVGGNTTLAIAAYNAGEDAVGKWRAQVPVDDVDLFVESIPYAETRLYVKTVTRNRFEYRRIYENSGSYSQQLQH